jgi:RNA polymerase sigma-70 factor (ECF subfamily)
MYRPEALLLRTDDVALIERALRGLPERFRELLVLRELEDLSYRELADVLEVPIGTIMSGLSRARRAFRATLNNELTRTATAVNSPPAVSPPRAGAAISIIERT